MTRVYGVNEAAAMFETVWGALSDTTMSAEVVLAELQAEREFLAEQRTELRTALSRLLRAVGSENFGRTGREMSSNLRYAIRQAEEALDD